MQRYDYDVTKDFLFLYEDDYIEKYAFSIDYSSHVKIELSNDFNILSVAIRHASKELNINMELLVKPDNIELFVDKNDDNKLELSLEITSLNRKYTRVLKSKN